MKKNLLQLLYLRLIAIIAQVATILFSNYFLKISLPLHEMMLIVLVLSCVNLLSFYSYKKEIFIHDKRLVLELIFDVTAFAAQIYLSGGISNPFISLFLLQVIIAVILLKTSYAMIVFLLTLIYYLLLSRNYQELAAFNHHSTEFFNLHLYGMLISYIIAAILLIIFITKISRNLRQKEQLAHMGLVATSAAHQLGTPLATIAVILNDLKQEEKITEYKEDLQIAESQIERCKKIISKIASSYGNSRTEKATKIMARQAFEKIINNWQNLRKPQNLIYNFRGEDREIVINNILSQTLFDIFDNAFEASKDWIGIDIKVAKKTISIIVKDRGRGFDKKVLKNLGKPDLSTKNSSGLGLFLAINSLAEINGKLTARNTNNGAEVEINIKL